MNLFEKKSLDPMSLKGLSESEKEELYRAVGYLEDKSHPVYSKSVCTFPIVILKYIYSKICFKC